MTLCPAQMPTPALAPTPPTAHAVTLDGYGRTFAGHTVIDSIDLQIAAGEVVAVLGASGCGKSTLLRGVGGLDRATAGSVRIDETPVLPFDPRCAIGFQEPRLLPWRTISANVCFGLPRGTPRAAAQARVDELLHLVGLAGFAGHRPRGISGGMAQRVSLARALARRPGVLLLDEPFGALDALTRLTMQDLLVDVLAIRPTTVLLVTHDVDEALHLADRIIVLGVGTGRPGPGAGPGPGTGAGPGTGTGTMLGRPAPGTTPGSATVISVNIVPGCRPRKRGDAAPAGLRAELLRQLGVSH